MIAEAHYTSSSRLDCILFDTLIFLSKQVLPLPSVSTNTIGSSSHNYYTKSRKQSTVDIQLDVDTVCCMLVVINGSFVVS